jgi:hypothetical protein
MSGTASCSHPSRPLMPLTLWVAIRIEIVHRPDVQAARRPAGQLKRVIFAPRQLCHAIRRNNFRDYLGLKEPL